MSRVAHVIRSKGGLIWGILMILWFWGIERVRVWPCSPAGQGRCTTHAVGRPRYPATHCATQKGIAHQSSRNDGEPHAKARERVRVTMEKLALRRGITRTKARNKLKVCNAVIPLSFFSFFPSFISTPWLLRALWLIVLELLEGMQWGH